MNSPAHPERSYLSAALHEVRGRIRAAGILTVLASVTWYVQAALVASIITGFATGDAGPLSPLTAAGLFFLLGVLRAVLDWIAGGLSFRASDAVLGSERRRLIEHETGRSPFAEGLDSASLAALASEKTEALAPYVMRYVPAMFRTRILPLIIIAVAFSISWVAGVIFLVTGPLIPIFMALVGMKAQEVSEQQMQEIGSLNTLLGERLRALADIRLLDASKRTTVRFSGAADSLRKKTMKVLAVAFLSSTVLELFAAIGVALMAVYVGFALLGEIRFGTYGEPLTLFQGMLLLLLAPEFYAPLRDLAAAWHDRAAALAVAGELDTLHKAEPARLPGTGGSSFPMAFERQIETRTLAYAYAPGKEIRFPDLTIRRGESLAITGSSGEGKSTLLGLLAGLVPASAGEILVDGKPVDEKSADAWRANIAWLPQFPKFLETSLRTNLSLAAPDATGGRIADALTFADAGDIVERLPEGLETQLGETGHGVSGGEARRLMIASAYVGGAPVLIADEPTADLDAATAGRVADGLIKLAGEGVTLIVATHDPELAARMNRQIALGDGE